jgi:hypothetical protein
MQNKRYYIDELGFYRYLGDDHIYYVCSNTNMANISRGSSNSSSSVNGAASLELCFRSVRHELRISHFDKTEDYKNWKQDWDEFIRDKLISRRPIFNNRQLKMRIRSGIPHDYRYKVWTALIRMRTRSIKELYPNDIYESLLKVDRKQQQQQSECFKQIELDLLRTLPNNRYFEDPNSIGIQRVRRVLIAYSRFDPSVGYCQGMNRLAAMALLVLPEEEAFWCLVAIIQSIMPKDYYKKPWLAQVDCRVLGDLLERKLPKLHKHLTENDIELTLFSWFFTLFVDGCRPELLLRIWDIFLYEGDKVLFRIALAILYIAQDELLKMTDFSAINTYLNHLVSTRKLDIEHLFNIAFKELNPFPTQMINQRREYHTKQTQGILESSN